MKGKQMKDRFAEWASTIQPKDERSLPFGGKPAFGSAATSARQAASRRWR